jgi:hypothetical protein
VKVIDTQVASGAANPKSIYIRPFDATAAEFRGAHRGGRGERPIRQSLAGREFANILKQEMEKIATSSRARGGRGADRRLASSRDPSMWWMGAAARDATSSAISAWDARRS